MRERTDRPPHGRPAPVHACGSSGSSTDGDRDAQDPDRDGRHALTAFIGLTGVAAADDPNRYIRWDNGAGWQLASCESHQTVGVLGQYGAWGWFIDGCATPCVYCPRYRRCAVETRNNINTYQHYGYRVTQNARLRVFNSGGGLRYVSDKSCGRVDSCWNYDSTYYLYGRESATSQCNGVRENRLGLSVTARNYCESTMRYL